MIDSHAHLNFPELMKDIDEVLARAATAGITHIVNIGTSIQTTKESLVLAEKYDQISFTAGIHPHDADACDDDYWNTFREIVEQSSPVGIGETGLDFFRDYASEKRQRKAFERQIELASELDLPIVIHMRAAAEMTWDMLRSSGLKRGVMHCFSESGKEAEKFLDLGFYISFAGQVTYPKSGELREAAKIVPLDKILIETDCPFLAPQPKRGKRNEPAYVTYTAECLSEELGLTVEEFQNYTAANARSLFNLPA